MLSSPPMRAGAPGESIEAYEGLVFKTAQMFHGQVALELDDMRQELRLAVLKARRAYHPERSRLTERAYVYGCVANRVKDMKRDAARRRNGRLVVVHVSDDSLDWFEFTYRRVSHDEVFGAIEDGSFRLPATITDGEQEILLMLVVGYSQTEIASSQGVAYATVNASVRSLREKMADWRPSQQQAQSQRSIPQLPQTASAIPAAA